MSLCLQCGVVDSVTVEFMFLACSSRIFSAISLYYGMFDRITICLHFWQLVLFDAVWFATSLYFGDSNHAYGMTNRQI